MKKVLLASLCAGMLFGIAPRAKAFTPQEEAKYALITAGVGSVVLIGGHFLCCEFCEPTLELACTRDFLNGNVSDYNRDSSVIKTRNYELAALLRIIKTADFDANKASKLVTNYYLAAKDFLWCDLCNSWNCGCKEKKQFNAIRAIKLLGDLFFKLHQKEKELHTMKKRWVYCMSSRFAQCRGRCMDEIARIKPFISEIIEIVRQSDLYQQQLKDHEQCLKEKQSLRIMDNALLPIYRNQ